MWRGGAWVVAILVTSTAAIARQQIGAGTAPRIVPQPALAAAHIPSSYPGIVASDRSTSVALPTAVTVRRLLVNVGTRVVEGQPVIELNQDETYGDIARLRLDLARAHELVAQHERAVKSLDGSLRTLAGQLAERNAALATAQRATDKLPDSRWKDSPERAQAAYEQAVQYERRIADLMARGAAGLQELEQAQVAMRVAAEDRTIAHRFVESQAELKARQVEVAKAQVEVDRVRQQQDRAESDLASARLRRAQLESAIQAASNQPRDVNVLAPATGVVTELALTPGDQVPAGKVLFKITTAGLPMVKVAVPSSVLPTLRRGQRAEVGLDGDAGQAEARIASIAPAADTGVGTVELEFINSTGALIGGRAATVRFAPNN